MEYVTGTAESLKKEEQLKAKVKAALKELGTSKTAIANSLKAKKIKGYMDEPYLCPLAIYLKKKVGKWRAWVSRESITLERLDCTIFHHVDLSSCQKAFIKAMDDGKYPFLIKEEKE